MMSADSNSGKMAPQSVASSTYDHTWPFLPVNEGLNRADSDFRFVLESGRSEWWDMESSLWLLMAESGH